jgi:hypothetical protein
MFNPLLKVRSYFIAYTGIWCLIAFIHVLILILFQGFSVGLAITESVISNLLLALIGLGLWFPVFFSRPLGIDPLCDSECTVRIR